MNILPEDIINRFLEGKRLSDSEYYFLENLLNKNQTELNKMMEQWWITIPSKPTTLQYAEFRKGIKASINKRKHQIVMAISKAAAVLLIPVMAVSLYIYFTRDVSDDMLTLTTQKGEVTNVILPDGSKVWLNVDSKLSYPINYGMKSRQLELEGEAYFEVEKNKELPFIVTSGKISTTALGTRFVISAYPESTVLSSSLIEGSVSINFEDIHKVLSAGQQLIIRKDKNRYAINNFNEDIVLAWKNNQLVFQLTSFNNVISELEKWYDINIEYNPEAFSSDTLTVRFEKYESMENVLKVISRAVGFEYKVEDKNIKITKMMSE